MNSSVLARITGFAATATALYYGFSYVQSEAIRQQPENMEEVFKGENDNKVKDMIHARDERQRAERIERKRALKED
ncbi:hypothetical protein SARC_15902, partial [Sphaeroforma arctica JP610]